MLTSRTEALPEPTTDLEQAGKDLAQFGYCLLAGAIGPKALERVRKRLDEQAQAENAAGIGYFDGASHQNWGSFRDEQGRPRADAFSEANGGVNQRVWMLVNKGTPFVELLEHKSARALIGQVLGEHYILSSYIANIANPGGVPMKLHTDQWWMPSPTRPWRAQLPVGSINRARFDVDETQKPTMIAPPACCNIMWMLDDFTEQNGATRIVPGSHMSGRQPDSVQDKDVEHIAAAAPAGTAMVFEGRLWHGTGANNGNDSRRGLLTTFCGPQFRPQENFTVGTSAEVLRQASPDLRELLGFRVWGGYGRTDSPLDDYIDPNAAHVPEMRPSTPSR